jgi:signal transduction histidine kinase
VPVPGYAARPVPPPRSGPGRPWWSRAGTVGAVTVAAFSAASAAAFSSQDREPVVNLGLDALALLVGMTLAGLLVLRRRWAVPLTLAASAAAVLLPLDAVTALIALPWVFTTASRRTAWLSTAAVSLGTAAALARDASRAPEHMILSLPDQATGEIAVASPAGLVVVGLLCVGAAVAAGLVRASRVQAERAVADTEAQAARADTLSDRMSRQEERELIAREVHDTVAHHISLISLQASALEVQRGASQDQVAAAAQQVRSSAQQAIAEMRGLITTLRDGDDGLVPGATLDDLAGLLDGARRQGRWVTSTVFVSDGADASTALTRATFRIVQEALTNALKHAPGQPVEVSVRASAATGVQIRVANPLAPGTGPAAPGTGSGLIGVRERAAHLRGTVDVRIEAGWHVLEARLPWSRD